MFVDRCCDCPWPDTNHGDAMFCQLDAGGAGQHAHAAFRTAIGGIARHGPILVDRRDIDDAPTIPLLDHLLGSQLRSEKGAFQIYRHNFVILLLGRIEYGSACFDAGIVHNNIQLAKSVHRLIHQHL